MKSLELKEAMPEKQQQRIYLDHSATTPTDSQVVEVMLPYLTGRYGNASSIHSFGQEAKVALEEARRQVSRVIWAEPAEIVFTASGTESDNWALKGAATAFGGRKRHLVTSSAEHQAVLFAAQHLEKGGMDVTYLPVDRAGLVTPNAVANAIREDTFLVSVMHVNNEVGTINPISEIGVICRQNSVLFHTDAVQSFGRIPLNMKEMHIDLLSISGHKIYGPKGVGALFMRQGLQLEKLLHGGKHERDRRAGTENVPGAVGLGMASQICMERMDTDREHLSQLRHRLFTAIAASIRGVHLNSHETECHPGILNLAFDGVEGDALMLSLDLKGIAVSNGSACTSGTVEPSHVLKSMGLRRELTNSALRFSLGRQNTADEIDYVADALVEVVARLRRLRRK